MPWKLCAIYQTREESQLFRQLQALLEDNFQSFWHHFAMQKLPRSFYDRNTITVAKELLGKFLVHKSRGVERVGRIVEVEAYLLRLA